MKALLIALIFSLSAHAAYAGLSERDVAKVTLSPPPNAAVPLDLVFRDLAGKTETLRDAIDQRPVLLLLVDFTCRTICGPALVIASGALGETGLRAGAEFKLIVVGLDPKDTTDDARAMLRQIGNSDVAAATSVLTGDAITIRNLTSALGYNFIYDPAVDQFAHPAGAVILTATGLVSRAVSSLALNPRDLRLALVDAGGGRTGTLVDRLTLLCYGFDATHGIYTPLIWRLLEVAAGLTILALAAFILLLQRRYRHETSRRTVP